MSFWDLKLHGHSNIFSSFGVIRSEPGTSSTTNHKFYRALGRPHGPWCQQALRGMLNRPWRHMHGRMNCQKLTFHRDMKRSEVLALLPLSFTFPLTTKIVQILIGHVTTHVSVVV